MRRDQWMLPLLIAILMALPSAGCDDEPGASSDQGGSKTAAPESPEPSPEPAEPASPGAADEPPEPLEVEAIAEAADTDASDAGDGVVRIGWKRDDVDVTVDGMSFPAAAGLGSWAGFKPAAGGGAMVMGDTVVFRDEVDAAMDAAFANGLTVTALHNHFFYDEPKVYFMHIGGRGEATELARGVRDVWAAIRGVRSERAEPATGFGGETPQRGTIDTETLAEIVGHDVERKEPGCVKTSVPREGAMGKTKIGGAMGLGSWAAFTGSDALAAMDGDFIMTAEEVQPVLRSLREDGIHVVALHNHMVGEEPVFYFTHFWGKGPAEQLARAFRAALDAQREATQAG